MIEGQWLATREHRRANEHALCAVPKEVVVGEIATGCRQAVGLPLELVVGAQGNIRRQLQLPGNLLHRADQLLELGVGHRQALDHIHRRHAPGDAVHAVEQALAPLHGVTAQAARHRQLTDLGLAKDERIEQLALAPVQGAGVIGELVEIYRIAVGAAGVAIVGTLVVDIVIPGRATDPGADVAVGHIQL
ncbi:hypothetical protein D3C79_802140 [compost metagenome]